MGHSITVNQGDIVLLPFPYSDLSGSKVRPCIVISNSILDTSSDVIVAQITSVSRNDGFDFLLENRNLTNSLERVSYVRTCKIFTCEKSTIFRKLSKLNSPTLEILLEKIKGNFRII